MQRLQSTSEKDRQQATKSRGSGPFNHLWAALILFTRLPWWKLHEVKQDDFRHAAEYWPFAGWITGGTMALTYALASKVLPLQTALLLALGARILLTGALHEDGLADFCDGMGGGRDRQHTLSIMKDSHIGTYGVLGLILYFLFIFTALQAICSGYARFFEDGGGTGPTGWMCSALLLCDVWGKCCASLLVAQLPYARRDEEAKVSVAYAQTGTGSQLLRILLAMTPAALLWWAGMNGSLFFLRSLPAALIAEGLLALYMRHRLGGYTGDCCGATFLLCEASLYLALMLQL